MDTKSDDAGVAGSAAVLGDAPLPADVAAAAADPLGAAPVDALKSADEENAGAAEDGGAGDLVEAPASPEIVRDWHGPHVRLQCLDIAVRAKPADYGSAADLIAFAEQLRAYADGESAPAA